VDALHSLENKWDKLVIIFVDSIFKRSTTRSFFDSFLSFSGWCGVRGSSEVTLPLKNEEGRQARVYSKALVEENGSPVEAG